LTPPVVVAPVRLVQVTLPRGERERVLNALDDEGVDYVVTDETSGRDISGIVHIPLPSNAVEPVLDQLRDAGLDEDAYTVVLEAKTVISRRFEQLEQEYASEELSDERIAQQELTAAARDLAPSTHTFAIMTVISALIATAGLLLDSAAVVVGSMVIAPLIGPAMATSVGTVVDDQDLFRRGLVLQVGGLAIAVVTAALFAAIVRYANLIPPIAEVFEIPEIRERVAPDTLSLAVALGSGAAGVISLTSGVSTALVGVMIAVALLPPAATVGIGIAWGDPWTTLGSTVLLLVNVLSINLAALLVLWYTGYRPRHWFRQTEARSATIKRVTILAVAIVVLSLFLGGVTLDSYQRATTEEQIRSEIADVVASTDAGTQFQVQLLDVEVEYTNTAVFRRTNEVVVTVGVPPGESVTNLADRMDQVVQTATGRDVAVQVRYVETEQS
jgi:uncharacterized hydrophobic protein (TIGR00341 family)